jgi:hypothetical protein
LSRAVVCTDELRLLRRDAAVLPLGFLSILLAALLIAPGALASRDRNLRIAVGFVRSRCPAPYRSINTTMWFKGAKFNALYGNCRAGDGYDRHIWFFVGSRFVRTDSRTPSRGILGIWRDDRTIAFMYVLYRPSDPNCCPTGGGKIVRFRWTGRRVRALDAIPRNR